MSTEFFEESQYFQILRIRFSIYGFVKKVLFEPLGEFTFLVENHEQNLIKYRF